MHPPRSKLVLPTVDTCRWRHAPADGAPAECGLVASLMGGASGEPARVSDETCAACCRSFPPSPRALNPVVASLLYGAASRGLGRRDAGGTGAGAAAHARSMAEAALDVSLPERFRLTPARDILPCAWRGLPVATDGEGRPPDGPDLAEDGPLHHCEHDDHDLASPSRCRECRDWARRRPISRRMSLEEIVPPPGRRRGRPVRNWAVGVTTSPRRQPTLGACLDGVARAGWEAPRLFLDGTTRVPPRHAHLPTTWREEGVGAWPAWFLSLAELVVQSPDADAYLMLQDDVILHDRERLRDYLERVLWPGDRPGFILLFYTGLGATPGWHDRADPGHRSAQALLFPPDLARALLADPPVIQAALASSAGRHTPIPDVLNGWAHRHSIDCWYPTPSLAQHVGNASTIWVDVALTGRRRASWFSGGLEEAFAAEEDLADFPEEDFPCDALRLDEYRRRVGRGRDRMRETSVVVCGLCRDARHFLPRLSARVERLGGMFRDYRVVFFEMGSTDRTREFLDDWRASNPRVEILSGLPGSPGWRARADADGMARSRNRYRDHVAAGLADFDHAIVVDAGLAGGWSYDGIAHTFGEDDWDFVGSLGLIAGPVADDGTTPWLLHDLGAFRPSPGPSAARRPGGPAGPPGRGGPMEPVESCFGGLGVYRMACLRAGSYAGGGCEHAGLHERLRRSGLGRLFLNPNQIALHSPS